MSRQSQLQDAANYVKKSNFAKAIEVYRSILSADPDNPDVRADLADAYQRAGNADRAFHHFHKAASIYTNRGTTERALVMLQAANRISSGEAEILFRMAECLKMLGRFEEMQDPMFQLLQVAGRKGDRRRLWALEELSAIYPDDLALMEQRAVALGEVSRAPEAIAIIKEILARTDPQGPEFARLIQQAADLAEEDVGIGIDLARLCLAHGRPREALALMVPHYEESPSDIPVLEALLGALTALGVVEKIIPARIELIKARAKLNQRQLGLRDITELLAVASNHPQALEVSAHAYSVFGELERAKDTWRALINLSNEMGLRAERDRAILTLLKQDPDDKDALEMGARSLREAGRAREAEALELRLAEVRARPLSSPRSSPARAASLRAPPIQPHPGQASPPAPAAPQAGMPAPRPKLQPIARIKTPPRPEAPSNSFDPSNDATMMADDLELDEATMMAEDVDLDEATMMADDLDEAMRQAADDLNLTPTPFDGTTGTMMLGDDDVLDIQSDVVSRSPLDTIEQPAFGGEEPTMGILDAEVDIAQPMGGDSTTDRSISGVPRLARAATNTRMATTGEIDLYEEVARASQDLPGTPESGEFADLLVEESDVEVDLEERTLPPEDDGMPDVISRGLMGYSNLGTEDPASLERSTTESHITGNFPRGNSQATYYGLEKNTFQSQAEEDAFTINADDDFTVNASDLDFPAQVKSKDVEEPIGNDEITAQVEALSPPRQRHPTEKEVPRAPSRFMDDDVPVDLIEDLDIDD